ncbi:MAG: hypothetical protein U0793_32025 [Gemmataceae bacterium]
MVVDTAHRCHRHQGPHRYRLLALGIDPRGTNMSNVGWPIPIADRDSQPIREILA